MANQSFPRRVQKHLSNGLQALEDKFDAVTQDASTRLKLESIASKSYIPLFLLGVDLDEWSQFSDRYHVRQLGTGKCYFDILDIPISRNAPPSASEKAVTTVVQLRELAQPEGAPRNLSQQSKSNIRICVDDFCEPNFESEASRKALVSQWRDADPQHGFELEACEFFDQEFRNWDGKTQVQRNSWARVRMTIRFEENFATGLRKAYITHQIFAPASALKASDVTQAYPLAMTERFVSEFTKLEVSYCCWRREANWRILLLLQYQHAMLNRFQEFLRRYRREYTDYRQHMFDARKSQLRQWGLNQLTNDSYQQRYIQKTGEEMIATLELLLELAAKSMEDSSVDERHRASFGLLAVELQSACRDLTTRFQTMADDLDHHLKFLDLSRNMRQADSVGMLTVLATIFLPMSLAASVLSMSTRFKDVGVLLYDLFGVVVIISVVIFILMILLFIVSMIKELLEGMRFRPPRFVMTLVPFIFVPYGALVLASFLVGMFKDVGLGAKILGIGTAVWPFSFYIVYLPVMLVGGVIFGIAVLVSSIITYMGKRTQPSQPQDQESEQNGGIRMVTPPRGSQEAVTAGSSVADGKVNTNTRETKSRSPVRQ